MTVMHGRSCGGYAFQLVVYVSFFIGTDSLGDKMFAVLLLAPLMVATPPSAIEEMIPSLTKDGHFEVFLRSPDQSEVYVTAPRAILAEYATSRSLGDRWSEHKISILEMDENPWVGPIQITLFTTNQREFGVMEQIFEVYFQCISQECIEIDAPTWRLGRGLSRRIVLADGSAIIDSSFYVISRDEIRGRQ